LLLGQLLLAPRQLLELLQRFVDLLLPLLSGSLLLAALVLVLLGIELEVEQVVEIATGPATAATAAAASERDLNLPERGLGAQQVLQRLLLRRQRLFPRQAPQP